MREFNCAVNDFSQRQAVAEGIAGTALETLAVVAQANDRSLTTVAVAHCFMRYAATTSYPRLSGSHDSTCTAAPPPPVTRRRAYPAPARHRWRRFLIVERKIHRVDISLVLCHTLEAHAFE